MAKAKTPKEPKTTKKSTKKKADDFVKIDDGMNYVERTKIKLEERKKEKLKGQKFVVDKDVDKITAELDAFISKSTKNIAVQTLSERGDIPYFIDTKSYALNWIITNDFHKGFPGTRAIMISGESGKGKSLILDSILGQNIVDGGASYKFDIEDAGTTDFTEKIVGSREIAERIRVISPSTLTKDTKTKDKAITIEKMNKVLNTMIDHQASKPDKNKLKSIIIGIDSLTQLTSEKELESNEKEDGKKDMTSAQKMRETFRVITQKQKFANMTIIGLAQLTADIGKMFGPKTTENAKGTGFKYASSLSLQATKDKEILKTVNKGAPIPIGVKMRFKTTKNRIEFKGRDAWMHFYFNKGIDAWDGLLQLLAQYGIMKASAKADVYGDYKPTVTFKWVHPDTGEVFNFKTPNFSKVMTAMEDNQDILEIWQYQLNEIYSDMMEGVDEAEMFGEDGPEDEEELLASEDDDEDESVEIIEEEDEETEEA